MLPMDDGKPPLVGVAVELPPLEVLGRDGGYWAPGEVAEHGLGLVSPAAGFEAAYEAGEGWMVTCSRSGQIEVRLPDGQPFFTGSLALVGEAGANWVDAALAQGALLVISSPGVTVNVATHEVVLDFDQMRWVLAPFTVTG